MLLAVARTEFEALRIRGCGTPQVLEPNLDATPSIRIRTVVFHAKTNINKSGNPAVTCDEEVNHPETNRFFSIHQRSHSDLHIWVAGKQCAFTVTGNRVFLKGLDLGLRKG